MPPREPEKQHGKTQFVRYSWRARVCRGASIVRFSSLACDACKVHLYRVLWVVVLPDGRRELESPLLAQFLSIVPCAPLHHYEATGRNRLDIGQPHTPLKLIIQNNKLVNSTMITQVITAVHGAQVYHRRTLKGITKFR